MNYTEDQVVAELRKLHPATAAAIVTRARMQAHGTKISGRSAALLAAVLAAHCDFTPEQVERIRKSCPDGGPR